MKLGIQVATGLGYEDIRTASLLAEAALRQGHEVRLFLMDDALYHLPSLQGLVEKGVKLSVCSAIAYERKLPLVDWASYGGQVDWATIVRWADRVLHFG